MRKVSLREPAVALRLREETARHPRAIMQISPEEGQFLALLARIVNAKRTLEVGVFTGYSSLSVALALPEDGRITALDISEEFTNVARRYWKEAGVDHKIDLRLGPAIATLNELLAEGNEESFDFAFIDADKSNYSGYYELVLRLLRPNGLIAIDNVLRHGEIIDGTTQDPDTKAMQAFNEKVGKDPRVQQIMLPIADGLTLACKL